MAFWVFLALLIGMGWGWVIGYCQRENDLIWRVRERRQSGEDDMREIACPEFEESL